MNRQEYFSAWAKTSNTTPAEFEKEFQERSEKARSDFPNMSDAQRETHVLSLIQSSLKRQFASKAPKWVGYFISVDDPRDANSYNRMQNKDKGIVNEEGLPVWGPNDRMVKDWKSAKAGDVIPEKIQRASIGVFYEEKEGVASELYVGTLYDSDNPQRAPPLNQWVRFRANCSKGLQEGHYSLSGASVTDFKPADNIHSDLLAMKPLDIIRKFFQKNACKSFKELPNFNAKENGGYGGLTMLRGVVADLKFLPKTGKPFIEISNPDLEMSLDDEVGLVGGFLAESIPLEFGIGSTAIFIGRLSYKEDRKQYNMNITGMVEENMVVAPANLQKIVQTPEDLEEE